MSENGGPGWGQASSAACTIRSGQIRSGEAPTKSIVGMARILGGDPGVRSGSAKIWHLDRSPAEKGIFLELHCGQTSTLLTGPARSQRR